MRNPWAVDKYTGPWSDLDSRWTPDLRKQVGSVVANDGFFFFPAKHFQQVFPKMSVAYYDESYYTAYVTNKKENPTKHRPAKFWFNNPVD